jgi:SAM-dependent methyltransferase
MARELGFYVKDNLSQVGERERFDCITMWHTLEHMLDIPSTLGRAAILLKPDGRLILAVPDWGGIQAKIFREAWFHLDVPRHLYHFSRNSLDYCLRSAGFSPEGYRHMEFEYDLLGWSQSALNRITPWPNLFFDILTGKGSGIGVAKKGISFVLGAFLSAAALPAVAIGSLLGGGGTLIAVAKKDVNP